MSVKANFSGSILKKVMAILAIVLIAHYGFAVDGNQGGKKSARVFSSIKSNLNFSLKSMYSVSNQGNLQLKRGPSMSTPYTVVTYHKGNQTWVMPYKNSAKVLQKFKTPSR